MLAHDLPFLLAVIPAGASRPATGVVVAVLVFLAVVLTVNTIWELLKGPPNP